MNETTIAECFLSNIIGSDGVCADMDDDCSFMTPEQVNACARYGPPCGYCPFEGKL